MEHGAIIDIGGIRGYLPSRELAGPTEALTEGELREFVVKDFEENGQIRVTFSLRLPVEEHARFGYDEYHIQVWEQEQMGDAEPSITILETQTEKATAIDINDLVIIEGIETTE
ncbi:hypothetical protein TFLX_04005 [Thermoflexales bacterium]|nr:hypothetical protein TFLX_04005 [Thermoflexales bacterium]